MNDKLKALREGRLKVGFVLPFNDLASPISRLRGAFPCLALRKLGVNAYVCSPANALDFDLVVLGRTYYNFKPCLDLLPKLNAARIPVVFDFCDVIKTYELLSGALLDFLESCQVATVSSLSLQRLYKGIVNTPVLHIDDLVDGAFDPPGRPPVAKPSDGIVRLGWTGLAGNIDLLSPLFPLLHGLHEVLPGRFMLSLLTAKDLGSRKYPPFEKTIDYLNASLKIPFEFMEWNVKTCREIASSRWDLALVPCPDVSKSCNRTLFASFADALPISSDTCDNLHALGGIAPELLCSDDGE